MRPPVFLCVVFAIVAALSGWTAGGQTTSPTPRVALAQQPFSPTGLSKGPATMADGGIRKMLADMGVEIRVQQAALTPEEEKEYGGWKRLGMALGHYADLVAANEREGYLTVGLLATCPSMPGLVAGLQKTPRVRFPRASPCCGSMRIPTSIRQRRRAVDPSAGCRLQSRPAGP